jgi:hypothetical protein
MANNQVPLEKTLVHLDLTKGIDETASPEVGGNQVQLITKMDNLVQKQLGSWVQRDGLTQIGATSDDLSNSIGAPLAGVRTIEGLGLIANTGEFYNYSEAASNFRRAGSVSEFSVTGKFITSSAAAAPPPNTGQRILACASNSVYDVVVTAGIKTSSDPAPIMTVYDREAGIEVARYQLMSIMGGTPTGVLPQVKICFVADRYLHVFVGREQSANITYALWDSSNPWPAAASGLNAIDTDLIGTNIDYLCDVVAASDRAILLFDDGIVGTNIAIAMNNSGTEIERLTRATAGAQFAPHSLSIDEQSTPQVWIVGKDGSAGGKIQVIALDYNDLSTLNTNWTDADATHVGPGAGAQMGVAAYPDGHLAILFPGELTTFGGTTIPFTLYYETASSAATAVTLKAKIWGWFAFSHPFYLSATERMYAHLVKYDSINKVTPHVLVCLNDVITTPDPMGTQSGGNDLISYSFRLAAVLEPMLGYGWKICSGFTPNGAGSTPVQQRYVARADDEVSAFVPYQSVARGMSVASLAVKAVDKTVYNSSQFGTSSYISGGYMSQHENFRPHEVGFVDYPIINVADSGVAGNPNGLYNYVAVYRGLGPGGELSWSRTYGPVSVTVASKKVTVKAQAISVTAWENGTYGDTQVVIDLYRTIAGGTQYFLCATTQSNSVSSAYPNVQQIILTTASGIYGVTDNVSDANIASNPLMHRQPGTNGAALDRYPPPASSIVRKHRDRLFTADPYGQRVYYSSFFVESESAWFNPSFSFQCHGGSGPITAIESMDGRLFVFKRDAVFVVDGDGPPENGGNGTEFSPPQRLAVEFGCVSPRSVIVVPNGIMYRSVRGFEILTRSLQNDFVGQRIKSTASSYADTLGVALENSAEGSRVRWLVSDDSTTREMVYDLNLDCWSTSTFNTDTMRHITTADIGGEVIVYMNDAKVFQSDPGTGLEDGTAFMPGTIETGFIKPSGPLGRHRLHGVSVLGKMRSNHSMAVSLAFDYSDTYTQTKLWEPDVLFQETQQVTMQSVKGQPMSCRVKVELGSPTDTVTYPLTTGKGMDLLAVAFEVAQKKGPYQVWSEKKG